jgi:hypothetical protein
VIDHLVSVRRVDEALIYYYCDFRDSSTTTVDSVMRTLLASTLQGNLITFKKLKTVLELKSINWENSGRPNTVEELYEIFVQAAKFYPKTTVVVDALDECADSPSLARLLLKLSENFQTTIRVLVSTRREQGIVDMLQSKPYISLRDQAEHMASDIETHVRAEVYGSAKLGKMSSSLKEEIVSVLLSKADGM